MLVYEIYVIIDCLQIGQRLNQGIPVMKGECANSFITYGLICWVSPVFSNANPQQAPKEWQAKMNELRNSGVAV